MSIKSQIERIKGNVDASLSAVKSKGVAVPTGSTSDDLPALISSISTQSGGVSGGQPYNLLVNSDFRKPVNQRGQTSYTGEMAYTIDRWFIVDGASAEITDNYEVPHDQIKVTGDGYFVQIVPYIARGDGMPLTFAACDEDDVIHCATAMIGDEYGVSEDTKLMVIPIISFDTTNNQPCAAVFLRAGSWKWAALYDETYTADTLPPYVPKGYALEYLECSRYYRNFVGRFTPVTILAAGTARMTVHTTVPMRVTPTVTLLNADNIILNTSGAGKVLTVTSASVDSTEGDAIYINLGCNAGSDSLYATGSTFVTNLELDAELYLE